MKPYWHSKKKPGLILSHKKVKYAHAILWILRPGSFYCLNLGKENASIIPKNVWVSSVMMRECSGEQMSHPMLELIGNN